MIDRIGKRRAMVLACGVIAAALLAPATGRSEDTDPCLDPWISVCVTEEGPCVDCKTYCQNHVGSNCKVEYKFCDVDTVYCPSPFLPKLNDCACSKDAPV